MFPANLDAPSAVGKVLIQEAGKMTALQVKKGKYHVAIKGSYWMMFADLKCPVSSYSRFKFI